MAYIPDSGSVAAWLQSDNASVITVNQSSIATVIIGGSIAASFTPPANQSVSGTVGASVIGNVNTTITSIAATLGVIPILSNNTLTPADGNNYAIQEAMGSGGNQLALTVGNYGFNYNGSNWDRVRGNSSIGTLVSTGASSVITVNQGSIATVIVGGSIAASFTPPANQSVSGSVGIAGNVTINSPSIYGNISGSVVAFQGTSPWVVVPQQSSILAVPVGSTIAVVQGSVAAVIIGGSIATATTNSSVMLLNGGNTIGSVTALQGTNPYVMTGSVQGTMSVLGTVPVTQSTSPWIITGSVQGSFSPSGNQSVSGTVGASIVGQLPAGTAVLGSVAVLQGTTPWLISSVYGNVSGSIAGTYTSSTVATTVTGLAVMFKPNISSSIMTEISPTWPLPITGAVAASISGTVATTLSGNPSISGTVLVNNGSVVAFQGTSPWVVNYQNSSIITVSSGSIATVIIGGSILTSSTANQSVSGTVQTQVQASVAVVIIGGSILTSSTANQSVSGTVGASVIGTVPVTQTTVPWTISSIYGNISGSIAGTYTEPAVQVSVTGMALTFKSNVSTSVMTAVSVANPLPVSVQGVVQLSGNPSISGTVLVNNGSVVAFQGTTPWIVGSVYGNMSGSVVAFPGTNPWPVVNVGSIISLNIGSIIAIVQGSVGALQSGGYTNSIVGGASVFQFGTWKTSIASNYATGASSIVSGLGDLILGVRNDTLGSVLASIDGSYGPFTTGNWGDQIVSYAPQGAWITGVASAFTGVEQPVITSVTGKYINVTGIQVANASANNVYLSFYGAGLGSVTGSIIGFTVAPANGGSNIMFPVPLRTAVGSPFSASISGVASVYLSAQGFYSKS